MKLSAALAELLAHPLTKGLSIDDPKTTELRSTIIQEKGFLRQIYESWYRLIYSRIPDGDGGVLEIGSGGGFLQELYADTLSSEIFFTPKVDVVLNAMALPFRTDALKSIIMVDVLHHIPEPAVFFEQATKCTRNGGRCLLIEPWNTAWGGWVFRNLHHEPFNPEGDWTIPLAGPLSGANGAMPWILLERDRAMFNEIFPEWSISNITPIMPVTYLLSGGVSMRSLMPCWSYPLLRFLEQGIPKLDSKCGMFAFIEIERL
jgi:SAM-dependent methyltransferase